MALHDYASQILGSRFTIKILKTLLRYRGKVFTIRELARVSGISHPLVSKMVKELETSGVVKLKPIGKAYQIILNEESYILKSVIEPLFRAEHETVNHLISTIRPLFHNRKITSAAIFGSVARGEEKQTSDIDLLVVTEDKDIANECVARASTVTLSTFGTALSPFIMDKQEFVRRRNEKLVKSILESYLIVYGKDLREIVS
ncbi:MAG: nucleotidyltransferase domain-containing protein [Nitrososphaerales archaeon]